MSDNDTYKLEALDFEDLAKRFEASAPRCAVCGEKLGTSIYLDVLDTKNGGIFRLVCNSGDGAHNRDVHNFYDVMPGARTTIVLKHVGAKAWADEQKVFATLWPWLRRQWH